MADGPVKRATRKISMQFDWRHICLLGLTLAAGCNSGRSTVGLQGEVYFDGRAVQKGRIDFLPVEGTAGGAAGDAIADGHYRIPAKGGVLAEGTYMVRITAFRKTGKAFKDAKLGGAMIEAEENFIPAVYNSSSTLRVRIPELRDKDQVDFRLDRTVGVH
jgi:hypothetical protein